MSDPLLSQEEIDALRRSLEREEAAPRLAPEAAEALADLFARSLEEALRRTAPSLLDAGSQVDGEEAPPNQAAAAAAGRRAAVSGGGLARWEAVLWLGQGLEPGQALLDAWCGQLAEALEGLLAGSVEVIPGEAWSPGGLLPAEPAGFLFRWQGGGAAREAGLVAPRGALEALVEAAARGRGTAAATVAAGGAPSGGAEAAGGVPTPSAQAPSPAAGGASSAAAPAAGRSSPHVWQALDAPGTGPSPAGLELLYDVPLEITVELGRASRSVREVLALGTGSVVELDRAAGEPVDILVNGKLVAHGEVVVIDDNFGIRVTDILSPADRLRQLG